MGPKNCKRPNFQSKWHPFGLAVAKNLHSKAFSMTVCLKFGGVLQKKTGGSNLAFVETANNTQDGWFFSDLLNS